jgi:hypothetical protein
MATILDVINGISQVMANSYDGAKDENDENIKIGLKREEGDPILDSRVIDGFKARINGDKLFLTYQRDIKLKELHNSNFESEIEGMLNKVVSFIKKEFSKLTGNSISLTAARELDVHVEYLSRVRTTVVACQVYKIGGQGDLDEVHSSSEDRLDATFKKFLELGGAGKRPKNSDAPGDNYKQFNPFKVTAGQRNPNLK